VLYPSFWHLAEEEQDFALAEYVLDSLDSEAVGPQLCGTAISAVARLYGKRRKYPAASLTVEGWRSGLDVRQAPPMPMMVCYALVTVLCGQRRPQVAGVTLLAFTAVLRIGEALALRMRDVLLPEDHGMGEYLLLLLCEVKKGAPDATRVIIGVPGVIQWYRAYRLAFLQGAKADSKVFGISYNTFRRWFGRSCVALGFDEGYYSSHSLRRGGATELVRRGFPLMDVMQYGRWASIASFRLYVAKGDVLLTRLRQNLADNKWTFLERVAGLWFAALRFAEIEA